MNKNTHGGIEMDPNGQQSAPATSQSIYQKNSKIKNLGLSGNNAIKQSVDLRILSIQQMKQKINKGQSSQDVHVVQ